MAQKPFSFGNRNHRIHGRPMPRYCTERASSPIFERLRYDPYGLNREEFDPLAENGEDLGEYLSDHLFRGGAFDPAMAAFDFSPRAYCPVVMPWLDFEPTAYVEGLDTYEPPHGQSGNPVSL